MVVSEVLGSRLGVSAWGVCVCVPLLFLAALKWVGLVCSLFLRSAACVHVYLLPLPADWCLHRPAPGLCFCDVARAPVVAATLVLLSWLMPLQVVPARLEVSWCGLCGYSPSTCSFLLLRDWLDLGVLAKPKSMGCEKNFKCFLASSLDTPAGMVSGRLVPHCRP